MIMIYNIVMKRSEQEGVAMIVQSYLKCGQKQQQQQQRKKVIKIVQIYGRKSWHKRMIQLMFAIFKKLTLKKEVFPLLCKRLLSIWDQILETYSLKKQHAYQLAISEIILESYTFIFPLIFQYRFHDLILDFKLYRMLWAKIITDQAFFALRTQISKNHGTFDLNKGFTQEHIDKIKKKLTQRGLTEDEIQRYMAVTQLEKKTEPSPSIDKRKPRSSSDDEDSDTLKKKFKQDKTHYNPPPSNQYNQYPYPNNPYQQPYPVDQINPYQARPNQPPPHIPPPNFVNPSNMTVYPPNFQRPYNYSNIPPNMHQGHHYQMQPPIQPYFPQPKVHQYPPYNQYNNPQPTYPNYPPANNFNNYNSPPQLNFNNPPFKPQIYQPNIMQPQVPQQYNNNVSNVRPEAPKAQILNQTIMNPRAPQIQVDKSQREKYKMLLNKLKKGLSECRECGMSFLSKQNLEEHKRSHFSQAQRRYLFKQSQLLGNSLGIQKQKQKSQSNFDMMCNVSEWVMDDSLQDEGTADYQVSIKRLPANERLIPVFSCYFCNQDLQIIWCEQLQQWTLNKGIKVHEGDRGLCIAHIDCYECFRAEEASFNTTSSLCY